MPFRDRITIQAGLDDAFIHYKKQRVEILADKKAYELHLEPYHKKMLRERKEEKEKASREKDRWCKNHRKTPVDGA